MFSNIGWPEIFVCVVIGVIVIGPERLPGVIQDVRAAIYAARKAIRNAKAELNGEFDSLGEEFDTLREPISKAAEWGRLGPRGALTKALFDDTDWDDFNPSAESAEKKKPAASQTETPTETASPETTTAEATTAEASTAGFDYLQIYNQQQEQQPATPTRGMQPPRPGSREAQKLRRTKDPRNDGTGNGGASFGESGFSWADIT